jgi:hypothetical protein
LLNIRSVENKGAVPAFRNFPLQMVKRIKRPFDNPDWLFEIRDDSWRRLRSGGRGMIPDGQTKTFRLDV